MHVPDGLLPPLVYAGGFAITTAATAVALRKINQKEDPRAEIPKAALLTAAFFIASSIRFPLPPPLTSVHLVLTGLMGVMLGWYAFPAVLIGLILQFLVFGHGGVTALGINACIMGLPALAAHYIFNVVRSNKEVADRRLSIFGFVAGFLGIVIAAALFYGIVVGTIPAELNVEMERRATFILAVSHLPIALLEGVFTALLIPYLRRVRPDMIGLKPSLLAR